ncbi:hypothetical protein AM588_10003388 [Phytophthora nicotianae]|uniref:Uncharacterized protein n=1 Tax=Phytophthora nicotianae TaxID=4792 RepID=A0A0W8CTJ6_PHYNI|nr:hypothetical protein AM588_10003388 [Phytophthora nicotianae]
MIWWYAHHGRIAFDGKNWAAYFGAAVSTSEGGCINIHQGDRMKVVDPTGKITADEDSFDWGARTRLMSVSRAGFGDGKAISDKVTVDKSVVGNRYQALKTYPDGSVAYLSKGKTGTSLQVVRFFGC